MWTSHASVCNKSVLPSLENIRHVEQGMNCVDRVNERWRRMLLRTSSTPSTLPLRYNCKWRQTRCNYFGLFIYS